MSCCWVRFPFASVAEPIHCTLCRQTLFQFTDKKKHIPKNISKYLPKLIQPTKVIPFFEKTVLSTNYFLRKAKIMRAQHPQHGHHRNLSPHQNTPRNQSRQEPMSALQNLRDGVFIILARACFERVLCPSEHRTRPCLEACVSSKRRF